MYARKWLHVRLVLYIASKMKTNNTIGRTKEKKRIEKERTNREAAIEPAKKTTHK